LNGTSILLIEDEPGLALTVGDLLRGEGYGVELASDGETGLERAVGPSNFGVILLDVMLPGIDGFEVCRALRRRGLTTPVLMLTARGEIRDRVAGLRLGADDYLVKPFDLDELNARVLAVARRYAGDPNPLFRRGGVEIDQAARHVRRDGKVVDLTGREWAILDRLIRRPNATIAKSQLEEALYAFGSEVESNAVEVHIHNLRKKLARDLIRNVRGVGYIIPQA